MPSDSGRHFYFHKSIKTILKSIYSKYNFQYEEKIQNAGGFI